MKLIFKGIVQGVGFRPTIYRVAKELNFNGYVLNKGSEVEVVIDGDSELFIELLKNNLPSIAKIINIEKFEDSRIYDDFKILFSKEGDKHSIVPTDIGICDKCKSELFDNNNRRYRFPFTNCTVCGARYSLIKYVPYDRERTSMDVFPLCIKCQKEYENPLDHRYHAQTISCPTCGPEYKLYDNNYKEINVKNNIRHFAEIIDDGKIGVIKSWGGMHICCIIDEIMRFRDWYNRPQKSFAVMVKDIDIAKQYGEISKDEQNLLISKNKPVVVVNKKDTEDVSPGLNTIGLFLPYTGLHYLLFSYLKSDALIMTSANIPGEPMMIDNNEVFDLNADIYLLHNRKIPNRIDDSVMRTWKGNNFFLRKSRGFIPDPIDINYKKRILSVGAGENINGAISNDKKIFTTQYIGNSNYYPTLEFLEKSLLHIMNLSMKEKTIDAVVMDLHPNYDSRKVAKLFADRFSSSLYEVQHHWAHAASLLVDRGIEESVVLTLDGLGYGSNNNFWGGEVLYSNFESFDRIGHLEYISMIGGDKATYDPRRLVYAIFKKFGEKKYFHGNEEKILDKMFNKAPQSSSMGRVLDALACFLNICDKRTYDGEPAMKLEKYLALGKSKYSFDINVTDNVVLTSEVFKQIDEIKKSDIDKHIADISYSAVRSIVDSLTDIAIDFAEINCINNIGLTGGVSYNIPIVDMIYSRVKKSGLKFMVHNRVPNGDGGIAIGQNAIIGYKLN